MITEYFYYQIKIYPTKKSHNLEPKKPAPPVTKIDSIENDLKNYLPNFYYSYDTQE
jgi:hypothetical protein